MRLQKLVLKSIKHDFKLIGRDSFLVMMFSFVIIIALFMRFAIPALNSYLAEAGLMPGSFYPEPLSNFYPMLVAYMLLFQGALLSGAIYGFLILDEKEDNTLLATLVTPVPVNKYLGIRMIIPAAMGAIVVFVEMQFVGLAMPSLFETLVLSVAGSLSAPIATLVYANFAENKLQGFAVAKFVGVAGWIVLIGWFLPQPWQWLLAIFPPFLVSKAYWMALEGNGLWIWIVLLGIAAQLAVINLMLMRFRKTLIS